MGIQDREGNFHIFLGGTHPLYPSWYFSSISSYHPISSHIQICINSTVLHFDTCDTSLRGLLTGAMSVWDSPGSRSTMGVAPCCHMGTAFQKGVPAGDDKLGQLLGATPPNWLGFSWSMSVISGTKECNFPSIWSVLVYETRPFRVLVRPSWTIAE